MYRLRMSIAFFFQNHRKKFLLIGLVVILLVPIFFGVRFAVNAITHRVAVHRFDNMPREDMISDFEYLMTVLEENWPFFNLSISANNVDVRELADNTRVLLNNPATDISSPLDFLDILEEHFFAPINQLGHLRQMASYEVYFGFKYNTRWDVSHGAIDRITHHHYNLLHKPEVVMFYSRLRDAGRGVSPPAPFVGSVMEFDILEEGRTAYMRVNRMINIWDDRWINLREGGMWYYEQLTYLFNQSIEGYEHLIIDLRGNVGGRSAQFDNLVMPNFLHEMIIFPGYVFYMGGEYVALAGEVFDRRNIFPAAFQYEIEDINIDGESILGDLLTLPYLDTAINFAYAFEIPFAIGPVYMHYGIMSSARQDVLFNGEIWLLTDERTASAAEKVAALLKYSGTATLVGEPTFGIMGTDVSSTSVHFSLPNTGIIVRIDVAYYTDPYGRPLQGYGIQPHYHNRPGMDALETVLAMIEERR